MVGVIQNEPSTEPALRAGRTQNRSGRQRENSEEPLRTQKDHWRRTRLNAYGRQKIQNGGGRQAGEGR